MNALSEGSCDEDNDARRDCGDPHADGVDPLGETFGWVMKTLLQER
jgi:hypothetical protein